MRGDRSSAKASWHSAPRLRRLPLALSLPPSFPSLDPDRSACLPDFNGYRGRHSRFDWLGFPGRARRSAIGCARVFSARAKIEEARGSRSDL